MTNHAQQPNVRIPTKGGAVLAALLTIALTGCAGTAGSTDRGNDASISGFEYGASQEEVNDIISGLEPVTLTYQPEAASPTAPGARTAEQFKEEIETRSNGQITIEIVWGQAVASYTELDDALRDGRVDIGGGIPSYDPTVYPIYSDVNLFTQYAPSSPLVGELAGTAAFLEAAWNTEGVISELEEQGLMALTPMTSGGDWYYWCTTDNKGAEASDWSGRQVRASTQTQQQVVESLGGSPVSLEYVETFEGLQRNTIDCTASQPMAAGNGGITEVAPNVSYLEEGSFNGRAPSNQVAGADVIALPLPYQQIIFDAEPAFYDGWFHYLMDMKARSLKGAIEGGGSLEAFPSDVQEVIDNTQREMGEDAIQNGRVPDDMANLMREWGEKWLSIADEMGYSDEGDLATFHEWYNADEMDFRPFADRMFEEITSQHRPR